MGFFDDIAREGNNILKGGERLFSDLEDKFNGAVRDAKTSTEASSYLDGIEVNVVHDEKVVTITAYVPGVTNEQIDLEFVDFADDTNPFAALQTWVRLTTKVPFDGAVAEGVKAGVVLSSARAVLFENVDLSTVKTNLALGVLTVTVDVVPEPEVEVVEPTAVRVTV